MASFKSRNTKRAQALRNAATPAERLLWRALSGRKVSGHKFSRQMPIGPYFADFLCREAKLVVELDGYSHDFSVGKDAARDAWMRSEGYRMLRFANSDVLRNVEGVADEISQALGSAHPQPLPQAGGGNERRPLPRVKDGAPRQTVGASNTPFPTLAGRGAK